MNGHAKVCGSEIWLVVLAIRLAALALTGLILLSLTRQPVGTLYPRVAKTDPQMASATERLALDDMRLHD